MKINKRILTNRINNYLIQKNPNLYRPSSNPYISGDTFRKLADHIFDETQTLKPLNVDKDDIVFLKTDLKRVYFEHYHTKIQNPYYLITHNSDEAVNTSDLKLIDSKVQHWYAMKLNTKANEKVSPIPAGLENARYRNNGKVNNFKKVLKSDEYLLSNKSNKILCSFNPNTNFDIRQPLLEIANGHPEINVKRFNNSLEYLYNLSTYKFNLCPEGNNFESHRIWESLLFGCTPIVIKNVVNMNFFDLGVPLLMLNSWDELKNYTCLDLEKLNKVNFNKKFEQFVTLDFWKKFIKSKFKD
tara:strand:+ start:1658 stop:2554 length:897 start_codon:yes stop_codon:yes gene_type:complete